MLLVLVLLFAVVDWVAVYRGNRRLEEVAKPAVIILLLAWVALLDDADPTARAWVLAALSLSLAGDVLLLPRVDRFIAGLAAFLLGHLAFLPALAGRAQVWALVVAAMAFAPVALVVGRRIVVAAGEQGGAPLSRAVVVYIAAVGSTVVLAVSTLVPAVVGGGLLFGVSDGILGWNRFVSPVPHGRTLTHVTYHLAQVGLSMIAVGGAI